jgi:phage-related protein
MIRPFPAPPMTEAAQDEAGELLWRLQNGHSIGLPHSRPMPSIGPRCHELRVRDERHFWRIVYRVDPDAVLVVSMFPKSTEKTPKSEIDLARKRLADYDTAANGG